MDTDLLSRIKEAGVVGAGGAGFPTHVKLATQVEALIVNACECEPLIRVDQQLLMSHRDEFLQGLEIALQLTEAKKCYIAIKSKHVEVVHSLRGALKGSGSTEIFEMADYYPAGDEQILVFDVLGKIVPLNGIPLDVGCVVCNVETLINVSRAVRAVPVTTTFVTVTGAVPKPATYELPIGMSYREALKLSGVLEPGAMAVIDGGPMMGKLITDLEAPITKTTKAIMQLDNNNNVVLKQSMTERQLIRQSKAACEQCQKCTDLCPRDLLGHDVKPHLIMRIVNYGISDFAGIKKSLGCSECGACELYACPSNLSPRRFNVMIKQQLGAAGIKNGSSEVLPSASEMFAYRRIPTKRLVARLGLTAYDQPAPLKETRYEPQQVTLLLKEHVGAPATLAVGLGDRVKRGDVVGRMDDKLLGANIHASIDGVVTQVNESAVVLTRESTEVKEQP